MPMPWGLPSAAHSRSRVFVSICWNCVNLLQMMSLSGRVAKVYAAYASCRPASPSLIRWNSCHHFQGFRSRRLKSNNSEITSRVTRSVLACLSCLFALATDAAGFKHASRSSPPDMKVMYNISSCNQWIRGCIKRLNAWQGTGGGRHVPSKRQVTKLPGQCCDTMSHLILMKS